jgi:hypothetical protein
MTASVTASSPTPIFAPIVEDLRWQTMNLSLAARRYAMANVSTGRLAMSMVDSLRHSREMLRLATRLTEVMTWVLYQREALRDQGVAASSQSWQPDEWLLAAADDGDAARMPTPLADLLNRSLRLYQRVVRLDQQLQSGAMH